MKKFKSWITGGLLALLAVPSFAAIDIVSLDETSGEVAFDPSLLATPIVSVVITTISVMAVLTLIVVGVNWIKRLIRGR
ncbi:MAG: hypothetical protein PHS65_04045 [Arcobacteraceae bacterium]|nr:hypothetical protein [Arcobacteraceae bacterium]